MRTLLRNSTILTIFILSGVAGLIYELVWTRMLVLIFGNTLFATSTVLSSFMAGFAAGSYFIGKYIDQHNPRLLRLYAILELAIGAMAMLFPLLLTLASPLYAGLYRAFDGNLALLNVARFAICFVIILIPTFMMGGTLPVLVKYSSSSNQTRSLGNRTGLLYGLNTLGAVVGCLICGFVLLEQLGMRLSGTVGITINIGVAVIAFWLSRGERPGGATAQDDKPEAPVEQRYSRATVRAVIIAIGLSGFCSLAYEVFWARMLALFSSNTVYSFSAILSTFLGGIALGSLIYYKFLSSIKNQLGLFVGVELGIGITALSTLYLITIYFQTMFFSSVPIYTFVKAGSIMLVPTTLIGISLPLAIQICQQGPRHEGRSVGRIYAINTVGSIFGAFAGGFIFIPLLGVAKSVSVVAALNLLAGCLVWMTLKAKIARGMVAGGFIVVATLINIIAPSGVFYQLYKDTRPHTELLHYKEGLVANVAVYDFWKSGYKDLYLNGVEEASSRLWHVQLFKLLGVLPPLVHGEPDEAMMIAFGAGMSSGAATSMVERLDCVELNPDIEEVAGVFAKENLDVYNSSKFKLVVNDGRNHLFLTPKKYSVIMSDATNPQAFDSWTLYTKEFYELCKNKLKPGGIFSQWVPIPLASDAIKIILNTFRSVFPHTSFWCIHGSSQCLMLATPERLALDYQALEQQIGAALDRSGFEQYGVTSLDKFLSFFYFGEDTLNAFLGDFDRINTDDLPYAQFYGLLNQEGIDMSIEAINHQESIAPYLTNLGNRREQVTATLDDYLAMNRILNLGFLTTSNPEYEKAAALVSDNPVLAADENVKSALNYDMEKRAYFKNRVERFPDDVHSRYSMGYIQMRDGEYEAAIAELGRALAIQADFVPAMMNLTQAHLKAGNFATAVEQIQQVRQTNPTSETLEVADNMLQIIYLKRKLKYQPSDISLLNQLAVLYLRYGYFSESLATFKQALSTDPANRQTLRMLIDTYEQMGFYEQAVHAARRLAVIDPQDHQLTTRLTRLKMASANAGHQRFRRLPERLKTGDKKEPPEAYKLALEIWNDTGHEDPVTPQTLRRAARELEQAIKGDPNFMSTYSDAAMIYEILGEYGRAAAVIEKGLSLVPGFKVAERHMERLKLLDDVHADRVPEEKKIQVYFRIAALFRQTGGLEKAKRYLRKAIELDGSIADLWEKLGICLMETGEYPQAKEAFEQALRLRPNLPEATGRHAWLHNVMGG